MAFLFTFSHGKADDMRFFSGGGVPVPHIVFVSALGTGVWCGGPFVWCVGSSIAPKNVYPGRNHNQTLSPDGQLGWVVRLLTLVRYIW